MRFARRTLNTKMEAKTHPLKNLSVGPQRVIAAAYAALTLVAAALNLAYGPVQFRFSEALTVLPFLFPGTWPGVFVGCLVANLLSPYGPLDVVLGSAGTLVAALLTQKAPKTWLAPPPVVCGMVLLGGMLAWYEVGFPTSSSPLRSQCAVGGHRARRCPAMGWGCPCCGLCGRSPTSAALSRKTAGPSACGLNRKNSRFPSARGSGCSYPWPRFSKARITRSRVCSTSWPLQSMVRWAYCS